MTINSKIVIDANVVVKWVVDEDLIDVETARKIYRLMRDGSISVLAPEFLLVELTQIFFRKKNLDGEIARKFLQTVYRSGIKFSYVDYTNMGDLIDISERYNQSIYDAIYLQTAKDNNCKLVTFDEKIWKKCDLAISPKKFLETVEI